MVLALAGACTGDDDPSVDDSPPVPSPSRAQDAASSIRFGVLGSPPTLDPYDERASDLTYALGRPLYPSLYRFLPDGSIEAYLARSIETGEGSALVELVDASWSDGTPITARDVVMSVRRAHTGVRAEAISARAVRFEGSPGRSWEESLASFLVLPEGRVGAAFGGPYELERYEKGYEVVLRRNSRFFGEPAITPRIHVRFVQDLEIMLQLLERGRLDIAAPPSTVNLDERLDELGIDSEQRVGWERIWLDHATAPPEAIDALLGEVRWGLLEESFVRDDGRLLLSAPAAPPPPAQSFRLIGGEGDELVALLMRAAWFRLRDTGHTVELLRADPSVVYGEWQTRGPDGVFIERRAGVPGLQARPTLASGVPVFQVASVVAWNDGVEGVEVHPSIEGPLWDAGALSKQR